ncbi:MAG: hypothetical protein FIA92_09300 [Chloroflexi bacterium]|nr:hypothetical protein [Chloroflexota bacterium]
MRRLRVTLGPREYDTITSALAYFLDTYYDPDEALDAAARESLRRTSAVWDKLARERVRQRVGWDATGQPTSA